MSIGLTNDLAPLGAFPLLDDNYLKGGYQVVVNVTARDAIAATSRKDGMLVYTQATSQRWKLGPGLTNGDWALDSSGSLTGPGSSTNLAIPTWNGTGGTALNNSGLRINPAGTITASTALTLTADTAATGLAISITGGTATANAGGNLTFIGGPGFGSNQGGNVHISGGISGATGPGASIFIAAAVGSSAAGSGGELNLIAGNASSAGIGAGGDVYLRSGLGGGASGNAGSLDFAARSAGGFGLGGNAVFSAGSSSGTGLPGGYVLIGAGYGGNVNGTGGSATFQAGNGGFTSGPGGLALVKGGNATTSGIGGGANLTGGNAAGTDMAGGPVTITGGAPTGTGLPGLVTVSGADNVSATGSNVALLGGAGSSSATDGVVQIARIQSARASRLQFQADNAGTVSIKAPATINVNYALVLPTAQGGVSTVLQNDGSGGLSWAAGGGGGISGTGTANTVPTWSSASALQDSSASSGTVLLAGTAAATGGILTVRGGNSTSTGPGGALNLTGGAALGTNQNGATVNVMGGNSTGTGIPGGVFVRGADAQGAVSGGSALILGGSGTGSSVGGASTFFGGTGGGTGSGGPASFAGGDGGFTSGAGGTATVRGGNAQTAGGGGGLTLVGGAGAGAAQIGGPVTITGGAPATTGLPGSVTISGAAFGTGGTVGSDVFLRGGRGSTLANDGAVQIARTVTDNRATRLVFVADDATTVSIKAPAAVTSYALTLPTAQGAASTFLQNNGSGVLSWAAGGGGGVTGPGTSLNLGIATWNGTGGTALFNNNLTISGQTLSTPTAVVGAPINITAGDATSGAGGDVVLTGGAAASIAGDGGSVRFITGAGFFGGAGGGVVGLAGIGGPNGVGGEIRFVAGTGGSITNNGGSVLLQAGAAGGGGLGGGVTLLGGPGAGSFGHGGAITLTAGDAGASGNGGGVGITAGAATGTGTHSGGPLGFTAGNASTAGGAVGNGGAVSLYSGIGAIGTGNGGAFLIQAGGAHSSGSGLGGALTLQAGNSFGSSVTGGSISVLAGTGGNTSFGGSVTIQGGTGNGSSGGFAKLIGGAGNVSGGGGAELSGGPGSSASAGGQATVTGGTGGASGGDGGAVSITGGNPGTTGTPGSVTIQGASQVSGGIGGNVLLRGGRGSTLVDDGYVRLLRTTTDNRATRLQFVGDDGNFVSIKAPAAVTTYALTWPTAQGAVSSLLQNNGSGVLSWATAGAGTLTTQDEGATQSTTVSILNVTGTGATISGSGATATLNIPGSTGITGPGTSTNNAIATWNGAGGAFLFDTNITLSAQTITPSIAALTGFDLRLYAGEGTQSGGGLHLRGGIPGSNFNGGPVYIVGGVGGTALGSAGDTSVKGGIGGGNGRGGHLDLYGGDGGLSAGNIAGNVTIGGGNAVTATNPGGNVTIGGGTPLTTGAPGSVTIFGADIAIGGTVAGDIILRVGSGSSAANDGVISIPREGGSNRAARLRFTGDNGSTISLKAPVTVTASYALVLPGTQGAAATFLRNDGSGNLTWTGGGAADVSGPGVGGSTDKAIPTWNGVDGSALNNSGFRITPTGTITSGTAAIFTADEATGTGRDVTVQAGGSSAAGGGTLTLTGGYALSAATPGGSVILGGGSNFNATGTGGHVTIEAGSGGAGPGTVFINGAPFITGVAKPIWLTGGRGSNAANDSAVVLQRVPVSNRATRLEFVGDNGNTLSIKAPAVVTAHAMTWPAAQGAASTFLQNDGSGGLTWAVSSGSSSAQNLVMTLKETTNLKVTEVTGGGMYFDPTAVPGTVTLRLVGNYTSVDAASSARVYLYDMGPGTGVFVPVRRAVVSIPFASVGAQMKVDQALVKVTTPGVDLNEIHDVARVYELRMYLNATDASPAMTVAWAGFVVV